ncbi:uncharacterized protein A1O9_07051 [Exophiala aquamarina CBS 119918]|uniref:Xylanolytic transcriptional activator regulatory domain-containing protein n=1 Tax=Exophiala aquamarina CBS 119918 TaxID=1182545 RepID=A0A072PAH7_9EURO|nr:uncharacterized protein A1O9_07051 [Exophiala aquamarina CBS 119918]KEF56861.1 hypothetical protein A1O9_07051 [Exophiala aquamarina CBS 119918]
MPENDFPVAEGIHAAAEPLPTPVELFLNLTIVPSMSAPESEFQPSTTGIEAIYELLIVEQSSLEGAVQESDDLQESLTMYHVTYLKSSHLRWPVLHGPTFDLVTASLPLAASACAMGAWFQSNQSSDDKFYALRVHDLLLQRLLYNLIDADSNFKGEAWPIEIFQATLLTLVFSLYRTDELAISRAQHLRNALIATLRELGAFNGEIFVEHFDTYFGGTYAPYRLSMRERFKRLLLLTYQFDAYFALVHRRPPILHHQEISVHLPSTFALWNTYGLDIFARRQLEEPPGRSDIQMCEMAHSAESLNGKPSQILVEDILLGLCAKLQAIWVLSGASQSETEGHPSSASQIVLFVETLDAWKRELDKINELTSPTNTPSNATAARHLLLAYRAGDDSMSASLERIKTLIQDGTVLYYFLKMYHYLGPVPQRANYHQPATVSACASRAERDAFVCGLQLLEIAEANPMVGGASASRAPIAPNPLIQHALTTALEVTSAVLSCQKCECDNGREDRQTEPASVKLQQWAEARGPLFLSGTPICVCKLGFWTGRFEKAIQDQKIMAE